MFLSHLLEWLWWPHKSWIENHFWVSFYNIWLVDFGRVDFSALASARGNTAWRSIIANWATMTTPNTFISCTFSRNDLSKCWRNTQNNQQTYCHWGRNRGNHGFFIFPVSVLCFCFCFWVACYGQQKPKSVDKIFWKNVFFRKWWNGSIVTKKIWSRILNGSSMGK